MRLVLAPWEWIVDASGDGAWCKPGGDYTGGCLDLRTLPQVGTAGVAAGVGLFAYETLPAGINVVADLGDDPLAPLSVGARRALETALELPADSLTGQSLAVALAEQILGEYADPTGLNAKKPLRMGVRGVRLRLKGFGTIYRSKLDKAHPTYAQTLEVRKHDYTRERNRGRVPLEALQMWTDFECEKLGISDETLILPMRFHADGRRKHATTLTETWPSDSTTLSAGMDHPWVEELNDSQTSAGTLGAVSTDVNCIVSCDDALSTDDHSHTASYAVLQAATVYHAHIIVRFDATITSNQPTNCYRTQILRTTGAETGVLSKRVAGASTTLDTETGDPGATGTAVCQADASAITGTVGSLPALSATDGDVTGYLQVGAQTRRAAGVHGDAALDSHTFEDVAAAPSMAGRRYYNMQQQAAHL